MIAHEILPATAMTLSQLHKPEKPFRGQNAMLSNAPTLAMVAMAEVEATAVMVATTTCSASFEPKRLRYVIDIVQKLLD